MFGGGGYCFGSGSGARVAGAGGGGAASSGEIVIRISSSNGSTNISIQVPQLPPPQTFEGVAPPPQGFHFGDGGLGMPPQGFQFGGTVPQDIFNFMQHRQPQQSEDRILCPQCGKSMEDGHFHKEENGDEEKK